MHPIEDRDFSMKKRIMKIVGNLYSVVLVEESIIREIFHNIRVVDCISTILRR